MKTNRKSPDRLRALPRALTLRRGSYRLVEGSQSAVTIKAIRRGGAKPGKPATWNETDWILMLHDALWEKAGFAYYEGLDAGFVLGLERGRQAAQAASAAADRALAALEDSLLQYFAGVEDCSVKLAMGIAEKVVGQAAEGHLDLVKQTVHRALADLADKSRILVRVHPSDYEALKDVRSELTALSEGIEHFKIEADARITPGSCRVETPSGLLDADFSTQLAEVRRELIGEGKVIGFGESDLQSEERASL